MVLCYHFNVKKKNWHGQVATVAACPVRRGLTISAISGRQGRRRRAVTGEELEFQRPWGGPGETCWEEEDLVAS